MNKRTKRYLATLLCALSVCAVGAFATGCNNNSQSDAGNAAVEVSQTLKSAAQDIHVKKGNTVVLDLPEGVTADVSAVKTDNAGSYEITYREGESKVTKTAYVYDVPAFGETQSARTLSYEEALKLDFLSAEDFGVTATDTFGKKLKVTAVMDKLFLGDYGEYTITYTAIDAAGNESSTVIKYTVNGAQAPTVAKVTADVIDEAFSIAVDFGDYELKEITFDDVALSTQYYTVTETGVTFDCDLFTALKLVNKSEYEIRVKTAAWCANATVEFTDDKQNIVPEFTCDGYIFLQGESVRLPVPQKQNRQGYTLEYTLNGAPLTLDKDGKTVTLNIGDAGEYTLTATAKQEGKTDVSKSASFRICTPDDYNRIVATCTDQFENNFSTRNENWGTFTYDPSMNAYKRVCIWNEGDGHSAVQFASGSRAFNNMLSEWSKYPYLALDIYFEGEMGVDFDNFIFYFNGGLGKPVTGIKYVYDNAGNPIAQSEMQSGEWYTLYVPVKESIADYAGWGYFFMTQTSKIPATPPAEGKTGYSYTDYWVKNIRFENEKQEVIVQNGYIYEVNSEFTIRLPKADEAYEIVSAPQGATIENGQFMSMNKPGSYTVKAGDKVISFTLYSKEDYAKIIDPLSTAQSENVISGGKNNAGSIAYDPTMGAYKFTFEATSNSWYDHVVSISTASDAYARLVEGRSKYEYMTFEFRFDGSQGYAFNQFLVFMTGNVNDTQPGKYYQSHFSEIYRYSKTGEAVTRDQMVADEWYTVYLPIPEVELNAGGAYYSLFAMNAKITGDVAEAPDYWLRNLRFENELPLYICNGYMYEQSTKVAKLPGSGWNLTSAPNGATIAMGNEIALSLVGDYVVTNGTDTIRFTIKTPNEYARLINPMNSTQNADFIVSNSNCGQFVFDAEMGAYKYVVTQATSNWGNHVISFSTASETYKKLVAGRDQYDYMAFNIYFDGTGGFNSDFSNFLVFMTGNTNNTSVVGEYYQSHFSEISIYNEAGVKTKRDNMRSGEWYTVYLPIHHDIPLNCEQSQKYNFFALVPLTITENGETTYHNVDFYLSNLRFETALPSA